MEEVKTEKSGYMLMNKPGYPRVPSWPNLVWIILLMMLLLTVFFWCVSFLAYAPLEEMSEWAKTPNPAKAPWYFIGLQELLVYFDPWIAGVMLPNQILIGLILIPYVDVTPNEQGTYDFSRRKFAVGFFTFGMIFWFLLIMTGQLLRGPSWQVYWPIIDYDLGSAHWVREGVALKEAGSKLKSLPLSVGLASIGIFAVVGMTLPVLVAKFMPKTSIVKKLEEYLKMLGPIKYFVVQSHVLMMLGVVIKVVLRLAFDVKYIIETPWFKV
jgi:hypothetical protein